MPNPFVTNAQSVINWFRRDPRPVEYYQTGASSLYDSVNRHNTSTAQSDISAVYNRIAADAANVDIKHIGTNEDGDYTEERKSYLNGVLTVSANYDQTPQAFMIDAMLELFEHGQIAIIPETTKNPYEANDWDVVAMRVARITQYHPKTIEVDIYDGDSGRVEHWTVPKAYVCIIENPLFYIMNRSNATLKRLTRTLALLDRSNDDAVNGKIDLIIHVPYTIHSETRQKVAEKRRLDIENQLKNSKYGIAYMDPTETVTQLNRAATNNLVEQVAALRLQAFNQLGVTEEILNGSADEQTMTNYRSRIIGMFLKAFTQEYRRKLLTPTARAQGQNIMSIFDAFEFLSGQALVDVIKILKEAEILSTDEGRARIGRGPSKSPGGDQIKNPNINPVAGTGAVPTAEEKTPSELIAEKEALKDVAPMSKQ